MTDSQLKYQTLQEDIRHNLAMERYNEQQAQIGQKKAYTEQMALAFEMNKWPSQYELERRKTRSQEVQAGAAGIRAGSGTLSDIGNLMKGVAGVASLFA